MPVRSPASSLPASETVGRAGGPPPALARKIADFEDYSRLFARWNGRFRQMSRGRFEGSLRVVAGRSLRLFEAETNQSILTRGMDQAAFATFIPITVRSASTLWNDRRLSPGQLLSKTPEAPYGNLTRPGARIQALLVPMELLVDALRVLGAADVGDRLPSWDARTPAPASMARLRASMGALWRGGFEQPGGLDTPGGRALEAECVRRLVDLLVAPSEGRRRQLSAGARSALVRRSLELMHADLRQPRTAIDLCRQLEVSDRTLRRAFRETFGLGPIDYQRLMRLHEVRSELMRARTRGEHTVAVIARRWGFGRLGPFAAEYQRQFGELPSHTLGTRGPARRAACADGRAPTLSGTDRGRRRGGDERGPGLVTTTEGRSRCSSGGSDSDGWARTCCAG